MLRPDIFTNFFDFAKRYCNPKQNSNGVIDFSGAEHLKELNFLLENKIMLRRLKRDVLKELP
jgi:SWI/SNF-related matrix-associated actin-dependent regulator 1 of chromatin subfamily A